MKKRSVIITFAIMSAVSVFPVIVFAQGGATVSISPNIPGIYQISTAGPCGWIVDFYLFALIIAGILAFGAIVYGGVLYATSAGNPSRQSTGRSWIWSALLGLLLLGGAWLILYTINPNLTTCSLPALSALPANAPPATSILGRGTLPPALGTTGGGETGAVAASSLAAAGVTIKSGASVDGMQQGTVQDIDTLAEQCAQSNGGSCNIVLTAGTDGAHAAGQCSHSNGYKADLRPNSSLDAFITSQPKVGVRSDGATLYAFGGGTIADERNLQGIAPHWDLSASCP